LSDRKEQTKFACTWRIKAADFGQTDVVLAHNATDQAAHLLPARRHAEKLNRY